MGHCPGTAPWTLSLTPKVRGAEDQHPSRHGGVAVERSGLGPRTQSPPPQGGEGHHLVTATPPRGGGGTIARSGRTVQKGGGGGYALHFLVLGWALTAFDSTTESGWPLPDGGRWSSKRCRVVDGGVWLLNTVLRVAAGGRPVTAGAAGLCWPVVLRRLAGCRFLDGGPWASTAGVASHSASFGLQCAAGPQSAWD